MICTKTCSFALLGIALVSLRLTAVSSYQAQALALVDNSKIVIAGTNKNNDVNSFFLARYDNLGIIDPTFGVDGITTTTIGTSCRATALKAQPDGKLLVAGSSEQGSVTAAVIARYTANGALDSTFGTNGIVTTLLGEWAEITAISLQTNGSIIATGTTTVSGRQRLFIIRYHATGERDLSFATQGLFLYTNSSRSFAESVLCDAVDRIVVTGWTCVRTGAEHMLLLRCTANGMVDTTFGTNGSTVTSLGNWSHAKSITIQADNTLIIAGVSSHHNQNYSVIARYTSSGSLDSSFGTQGIVETYISPGFELTNVACASDGKIYAIGCGASQLCLVRLTTTGTFDTTWDDDGQLFIPALGSCQSRVLAVRTQDQKIFTGGFADDDVFLASFLDDGYYDTAFGIAGIVSEPTGEHTVHRESIHIWDERSIGSNGGDFTAGNWIARSLNKITWSRSAVKLTGNRFMLKPGVYDISVRAPAYRVGDHQIRLFNATDNAVVAYGSSETSSNTVTSTPTQSQLSTRLILGKNKTYEVQHQATISRKIDGLGRAAGFGPEIYTEVKITKL